MKIINCLVSTDIFNASQHNAASIDGPSKSTHQRGALEWDP